MQEFTEKDCMQTEKEASIQNRVVVLPDPSIWGAGFTWTFP